MGARIPWAARGMLVGKDNGGFAGFEGAMHGGPARPRGRRPVPAAPGALGVRVKRMKRWGNGLGRWLQNRLVLLGAALGAVFWVIESLVHVYVFDRVHLFRQLVLPGLHETWMRLVVVGMFVLFGIYAQRIVQARRKDQEAISRVNAELAQIFETAADGMRVVDGAFTMLRANRTFCTLAGVRKEEALGRKCYEVFRGPLCGTDGCPLTRILRGETRVEADEEKVVRDGTAIPCIVTATPFRDAEGRLIGIVEDFKDISDRKQAEEELRQSQMRLRELASYLESAREQERTRIAREIHDELGQALTALKMDVHWLAGRLHDQDPRLAGKARAVCDLIDANVRLVQRIASDLRPGILDNLGLAAAMEWQAGQFQERTGTVCTVLSRPADATVDPLRSTALFRIFQEAITNVARHAGATQVRVLLEKTPGRVILEVQDNGRGIREEEIADEKSFGILGIRERVHSLGGAAAFHGEAGRGTRVRVEIPLAGKESPGDQDPGGG